VSKGKSTSTERLLEIIRGNKAAAIRGDRDQETGPVVGRPAQGRKGKAARESAR